VEVEGQNVLTSIGFDLQRTTTDSRFRPTRGTRTEINFDQAGAIGGDYTYSRFAVEHNVFLTIDETELGYKTILSLKTMVGYLFPEDEAPVFERFYLGGRSLRGFDYRGIGPVGINSNTGNPGNDHVGGDFMFFLGVEVEKPVWKDVVAIVGFIDSGTVNDNFGFENYRLSVGTGVRLYLPQFGQAPLAFDFAFPLMKEDTDDEQLFSFSFDIPF
jgi:outer membrane protein insertion porin family